ncbi:ATP synthase F0 subunit 8 (mitochondrion) [Anolis carolinensis]|uniref:ATP synthase complex subunit 8 n=1 Tax=Anolis carolinensis TaxID=28377 RepID=B3GSZ4_ANOCA|nr:ATP synthase F0 subunit 8 [Anolis carolinensis]|eukprot:YP_001974674.2 ATP synthase F0 subunit 8 (mitochondrion) [Anolis carolinensis]
MPQLNPSPWLMIFFLIWLFLTLVLFNKALKPMFPNTTETKEMTKPAPQPWNWPWY